MKETRPDRNQLIRIIVVLLALLVLMIIPFELLSESKPVCFHYQLLGIRCPFCGLTRAVHRFVHLQFHSAIQYNAVVVLLPFYLILDMASFVFPRDWLVTAKRYIVGLIMLAFVILYVFRIVQSI